MRRCRSTVRGRTAAKHVQSMGVACEHGSGIKKALAR